jgi:glycosyltransferase involved in cell wall biosynthesis
MKRIKVSACIITYNHEKYISQCIEGVLSQNLKYEFEIIIGDDNSTDSTLEICKQYEEKYPDLIKVIDRENNLGMMGNWRESINYCNGDFIALCEGDDIWNDPNKLNKQVSFLIKNPTYILTYHNSNVINDKGLVVKEKKLEEKYCKDYSPLDLQKGAYILTLTMCFRNNFITFPPEWDKVANADIFLVSLLGKFGSGKFLNHIVPSSYRIHSNGLWSSNSFLKMTLCREITYQQLMNYHRRENNNIISSHFTRLLCQTRGSLMEQFIHRGEFIKANNYAFKSYSMFQKNKVFNGTKTVIVYLKAWIKFLLKQLGVIKY